MKTAFDGTYAVQGAVEVSTTPADAMRWLVEPELMVRWMLGVDAVEPTGDGTARVRSSISAGQYGGGEWSFLAEVVERAPDRLVRRYRMASMGSAWQTPVEQDAYERLVAYDLRAAGASATSIACTITTTVRGMSRTVARLSTREEEKCLKRSLGRLRKLVAGERPSLVDHWRDSNQTPTPL